MHHSLGALVLPPLTHKNVKRRYLFGARAASQHSRSEKREERAQLESMHIPAG